MADHRSRGFQVGSLTASDLSRAFRAVTGCRARFEWRNVGRQRGLWVHTEKLPRGG